MDVINDDDHLERCGGMVGKVRFLLQWGCLFRIRGSPWTGGGFENGFLVPMALILTGGSGETRVRQLMTLDNLQSIKSVCGPKP